MKNMCSAILLLDYFDLILVFPLQSRSFLKDRRKFVQLVDPLLQGRFPLRCLHHAIAITAMCIQEQPTFRPLIGDIVVALEYLAAQSNTSELHNGRVRSPTVQSPSKPQSDEYDLIRL